MRRRIRLTARKLLGGFIASLLLWSAASSAALAQSTPQRAPAAKAAAEGGPRWAELSASQRLALKPLERDWSAIEPDHKQKWIEVAGRMPRMPQAERERVQARMADWARMSPQQRGRARLAYQEATQVAPKDRQAQWEAYQALPAEQRRQLAAKAVSASAPAGSRAAGARSSNDAQAKSNIVPNPAFAAQPKQVAPSVVQAQPGATTTLISKRATPPAHQQTGLPKIAATPEFVDKTTLLPRRGAQGAAARTSAASAPAQRP
jgi:hypothetical protein